MTGSPGRGRPVTAGRHGDAGTATAETAVVLPALAMLLAVGLWSVAVAGAQLRCVDAAREGARALARGEPTGLAAGLARQAAPRDAVVDVSVVPGRAVVVVRAVVGPGGWLAGRLPGAQVSARAQTPLEPGVVAAQDGG